MNEVDFNYVIQRMKHHLTACNFVIVFFVIVFGNEVGPSNKGKRFQSCEVEDGHWLASHLVLIKTVK